jgi:predicted  nucleic acid-binding Zn-ribbon protein
MPGPAAILREIHRLRRYARDLQNQIDRAPLALKAQEAKVARQEETLREAHEAIKRLKVTAHDKEVTLRGKVQQISKHQQQLNESTSKKEYDALQAEIASEKRACSQLEDQILDAMAETEDATARIPELEQAVRRAKEQVAEFNTTNQARQVELAAALEEVNRQLREIETSLPSDVRSQYERQLASRGEDALSAAEGRICTACYTEITAQNYNELRQDQFVLCKSCGRILYLPESVVAKE